MLSLWPLVARMVEVEDIPREQGILIVLESRVWVSHLGSTPHNKESYLYSIIVLGGSSLSLSK